MIEVLAIGMKTPCTAKTAAGDPCPAPAQTGRPYCYQHDPAKEQARALARRRGGETRAAQLDGRVVSDLSSAAYVQAYLARVVADVEDGLLDWRKARGIAALCRTQLDAIVAAHKESWTL